jgi:solute:Na+ symporter, SSS family
MNLEWLQIGIFILGTAAIGWFTYLKCRGANRGSSTSNKEYFLANGGLSWIFVAGSITLTNLSTDQLVGMNGNQMALLAWWEFAAVIGLIILAKIFLPVYYKNNCTTTTELLEKKYKDKNIRAVIGSLFLLANTFIFLPALLYGGSLFMQSMFQLEFNLMYLVFGFAIVGAAYAILGGLRAVAVSDTYSGVLIRGMSILVVFLSLKAIGFDLSGIPKERLSMIGGNDSPIPWHTLLTGMIFIQTFYWSTNQTITQRAMAAPNLKEAQKGVFAAAGIRLLIVPAIVVIPGIVAFKLYGDIGDLAYGRIVGEILPPWLSGLFAAALAAAVLTSYNSALNSSATLYVCDIHESYINKKPDVRKISNRVTAALVLISISLVPLFQQADSLINLIQKLWGLVSMPILSVFIVGLLFNHVHAKAAITSVIFGTGLYAIFTFAWEPLHYIHLMLITLISCVCVALLVNRVIFGQRATLISFGSESDHDTRTQ